MNDLGTSDPDDHDHGVLPGSSDSAMEAICEHMEKWLGPVKKVWHELESRHVHVDVHLIAPNEKCDDQILFTTGMSDLPMKVDPEDEDWAHAELVMMLPADWPLEGSSPFDNEIYWPIRELAGWARYPHRYKTWLSYGHSIANGDPPEPYAFNTTMCAVVLLPPYCVPPEGATLTIRRNKTIRFWMPLPIHVDEMQYKLEHGTAALEELLEQADIGLALDVSRPSVLP